MFSRITVSRNPASLVPREGIFHGLAAPWIRPLLMSGAVVFFSNFSGCAGQATNGVEGNRGDAPRRLSGVPGVMDSADDAFLSSTGGNASAGQASAFEGRWSLLLATVVGPNHPMQARATRDQIAAAYPALRSSFVRPQGKGSAVWFGRFERANDPDAVAAREMVRGLKQSNGQPVFARAFFSILPDDSPVRERDLRNLRRMYPGVEPLYSLQVACWGTFGTDEVSVEEVRRSAERYVSELRGAGHDAWYYHDPVTELSVVTIGVFDSRAYDGRSTLFSAEVETVMRDFPVHRVNGEDVMVEMTAGDPSTRIPQPCRLVIVPMMP